MNEGAVNSYTPLCKSKSLTIIRMMALQLVLCSVNSSKVQEIAQGSGLFHKTLIPTSLTKEHSSRLSFRGKERTFLRYDTIAGVFEIID